MLGGGPRGLGLGAGRNADLSAAVIVEPRTGEGVGELHLGDVGELDELLREHSAAQVLLRAQPQVVLQRLGELDRQLGGLIGQVGVGGGGGSCRARPERERDRRADDGDPASGHANGLSAWETSTHGGLSGLVRV